MKKTNNSLKNHPSLNELDILEIFKKEIKKVESSLEKIEQIYKEDLKWFEHLSDHVSGWGGSWKFITLFLLFVFIWMFLNIYILATRAFDPYPFILLNLILSCMAAIQAPIILMSQNRAAKRDQARLEMDLEKDLRDLHVDEHSLKLILKIQRDIEELKKKSHHQ